MLNAHVDYLRQRLAEANTVLNSIPPICTEAREIVEREIVLIKKAIRYRLFLTRNY